MVGGNTYRQLFTMHGVVMVFLFLLPLWLGLVTALVPLQIGATRMAFPRVHALSLWLFLGGAAMVVAAPLVSDVVGGWTLSDPLPDGPEFTGEGVDLVILGLIAGGRRRHHGGDQRPGHRPAAAGSGPHHGPHPPVQLVGHGVVGRACSWPCRCWWRALLMLFVDRHYGGHVFNGFTGSRGGNPLLWPRLFWFAAFPLLWALLLPALGAVSDIVPVFARRELFSHQRAVAALAAVGVLSFAGWGSEVASLRRARPLFALGRAPRPAPGRLR